MAKKTWKEFMQERKDSDKWYAGKYIEEGYKKVSELFKGTEHDKSKGNQSTYSATTDTKSSPNKLRIGGNQRVPREPFLNELRFDEQTAYNSNQNFMPMNPPGQTPNPIIDYLYSPMMKGLVEKAGIGHRYGGEGLLGQAIFNKVAPDNMDLNLGGELPKITYSPNDSSIYSAGPSHREGDSYSGIQLSGKWEF